MIAHLKSKVSSDSSKKSSSKSENRVLAGKESQVVGVMNPMQYENGECTIFQFLTDIFFQNNKILLFHITHVLVYCTYCNDENDYCPFCGCMACHYKHFASQLLICDGCNKEYHTFCISPPLTSIPDGQWFCPQCMAKDSRPSQRNVKDRNHVFTENQFSAKTNTAISELLHLLSRSSPSNPLLEEDIDKILTSLSVTDILQVQTCMLPLIIIPSLFYK